MQGSIAVSRGQTVAAGTVLGRIGYSGRTEFPHLEFLLRRDGAIVDPFDPGDPAACATGAEPLWSAPVVPSGGGLLSAGFADGVPGFDAIKAGAADTGAIPAQGPALVIWAYVHGGRAGDRLALRIARADGAEVHAEEVTLERTQAQLFRASGRRTPEAGWPPGLYRGEVRLIRGTRVLDRAEVAVALTP